MVRLAILVFGFPGVCFCGSLLSGQTPVVGEDLASINLVPILFCVVLVELLDSESLYSRFFDFWFSGVLPDESDDVE
jgi:hypothetical protein